ncbi:histidine phosphatase superfamily [Desarmillaria ectypa]|nr:histidine phosphatase superfamily [Desarmillaria ectypa]
MNSQEQLSKSAASGPEIVGHTLNGSRKSENTGECLILTLVRHAQAESNVSQYKSAGRSDSLTDRGRYQAEQLGKELSSTRIDHLISSPYLRALDTARAIGRNNIKRPDLKPEEDERIIEQNHGPQVDAARRSGNEDLEFQLRTGQSPCAIYGYPSTIPRSYHPPGGESLESVSLRAEMTLLRYLRALESTLRNTQDSNTDVPIDSTDLIDGVPHVVVVSHNIFLTEFYEAMVFFNDPLERYNTPVQWRNAGWARYIVFFDGERLEIKTMKEPY